MPRRRRRRRRRRARRRRRPQSRQEIYFQKYRGPTFSPCGQPLCTRPHEGTICRCRRCAAQHET